MKIRWILIFALLAAHNSPTQAGILARFHVSFPEKTGNIDVELFEDKPITTGNFIHLAESGRYINTYFHRSVSNFVAQGGGFSIDLADRVSTTPFERHFYVTNFGVIKNEYSDGQRYSNTYGTIAMARSTETNSATSQWFFNLNDNSFLDGVNGGFTVFGRVLAGFDLLETFRTRGLNGYGVIDMTRYYGSGASVLSELPVGYIGEVKPRYVDLIYADISILRIRMRLALGGREIAWNSVEGRTNIVEYTGNLASPWQVLSSSLGTGSEMKAFDNAPRTTVRFYRIRIQY